MSTNHAEETKVDNEEEEEEEEGWANSKSKAILRGGILSGEITPDMKPRAVFNLNPEEHGKWNYRNWSSSLSRLRKAVAKDQDRMLKDCIAYGHDLAWVKSNRTDSKIPWHRSEAHQLLKKDVDDDKDVGVTPSKLYALREEYYNAFDLNCFRKHLYQERDSRPKRAIRFEKKKSAWKYPEVHKDHPRLQNK